MRAEFARPPELRRRRYTGRRLQGIRYEKAAHEYLTFRYGDLYVASPWLHFLGAEGWRWCQPDGILFQPTDGRLIIVEIKYQHTADAWWQVRKLYQPVLEKMFPPELWGFEACELVKWYDPAVLFPERVALARDVEVAREGFKVHIWKP